MQSKMVSPLISSIAMALISERLKRSSSHGFGNDGGPMGIFVVVFLFMVALVVAMAIGVLMGRQPIAGSCGGMSALGLKTACEICGGDDAKCEEASAKQTVSKEAQSTQKEAQLFHDAATDRKN